MNNRGTALVATLSIALVLLPLGAFVAMQCRTDLLIQHNLRAEIEAFYTAEAGLEHAISEIGPGTSFDPLLSGPDRLAGTRDDGAFPFRGGSPAPFPHAPFQYDVRVIKLDAATIRLVSTGTGIKNAVKIVNVLATRSSIPHTPAALYVEGDPTSLDVGSGSFVVSGMDHNVGAPAGSASGAAAPIPALSTSQADAEATLAQRLTPAAARRLIGTGGTPSIAHSDALDLASYAAAVAGRPEAVNITATTITGRVVLGTPQDPQISLTAGDCEVSGQVSGRGILLVNGRLRVVGTLSFAGLVLAMGGVLFEPGSAVTIDGTLWQGAAVSSPPQLRGDGAIAYSSAALAAVDRRFPGLLPHAVVIAGWQEQL